MRSICLAFAGPLYSLYGKRGHAARWTEEETGLFFHALSAFGTDFDLIARLFPTRTRSQVKVRVRAHVVHTDPSESSCPCRVSLFVSRSSESSCPGRVSLRVRVE